MLKVYKHNGVINLIVIMHRFEVCKLAKITIILSGKKERLLIPIPIG